MGHRRERLQQWPSALAALGLLAASLLLPAVPATAAQADPDKLPVTHVQDLHYGDVLFYFYQDENFEALTRLEAYSGWTRLPHHDAEAELLAGGLYLQLGLYNEAGARFEKLLAPTIPAGVRNRAWFYLAKVWYARGYLDKAEHSLRQIEGRLTPALEGERQHLLANALMRQGRFDEAIGVLTAWRGPVDWMAYAQFNLGVALVRSGRLAEADRFLSAAGSMDSTRAEMLALKDKANLALGFAYLQANEPAKAKVALQRVRLNGPQSNKALLGAGWADAALEQYRDALAPWLELHDRNLLDAAVQESFLAVPYAFGRLNANAQAADYYEQAIASFDAETQRIDAAISRIHDGRMLDALLGEDTDKRYGWFWQLKALPDAPESRYLYTVLAGNDFQEGLKNYRDLHYLAGTLARWDENMVAYDDMIEARERAFGERLPRADALLASSVLEELDARRAGVEGQLNELVAARDVAGLGSSQERDQWQRIQRLEEALAAQPESEDNAALRDKLRLAKGVLAFRLDGQFKSRLWEEHRELRQLDAALTDARNRWVRVQNARRSTPTDTNEFAQRIERLQERLTALRAQLAAASEAQNDLLEALAVRELRAQQERLAEYRVQARFALATIYDRASNEPAPPVPVPVEPGL